MKYSIVSSGRLLSVPSAVSMHLQYLLTSYERVTADLTEGFVSSCTR